MFYIYINITFYSTIMWLKNDQTLLLKWEKNRRLALYKESVCLIKLLPSFCWSVCVRACGPGMKILFPKVDSNHECQFSRRSLKIYTESMCVCVIFSGMMSWKGPQFKQTFSCNDKRTCLNDNWVNVTNQS